MSITREASNPNQPAPVSGGELTIPDLLGPTPLSISPAKWWWRPVGFTCFALAILSIRVMGGALGALIGLPFFWLGGKYLILAKRARTLTDRAHVNDTRSPVVYLRSFDADPRTREIQPHQTRVFTLGEQFAMVFEEFGPFVALHNPGESLPEAGAARVTGGADWKGVVLGLLKRAQMVVVLAGSTPNLLWEMKAIVSSVSPERIVILFRGRTHRAYDVCAAALNPILPKPLPPYPAGRFRWLWPGLNVIAHFDGDWTPHVEQIRTPYSAFRFDLPLYPALKVALRPVLQRLSLRYEPPAWTLTGTIGLPLAMITTLLGSSLIVYVALQSLLGL